MCDWLARTICCGHPTEVRRRRNKQFAYGDKQYGAPDPIQIEGAAFKSSVARGLLCSRWKAHPPPVSPSSGGELTCHLRLLSAVSRRVAIVLVFALNPNAIQDGAEDVDGNPVDDTQFGCGHALLGFPNSKHDQ